MLRKNEENNSKRFKFAGNIVKYQLILHDAGCIFDYNKYIAGR